MLSLVYVSVCRMKPEDRAAELAAISRQAVQRNLSSRVTGALACTPTHFVQVLEGPEAAVREIMDSIRRDPRHCDLKVVRAAYQTERRFANWGLALVAHGPAFQRQIDRATAGIGTREDIADALITAMERSATPAM